jgi:hypothetical protein
MRTNIYSYVWSKYRPAILKLMTDSVNGPQVYKFSAHEFRNVNPKQKGGYTFTFRMFQGKSISDIRNSPLAKDLLWILQQSKTAAALTENDAYEFSLNKTFDFQICRILKVEEGNAIIESPALEFPH